MNGLKTLYLADLLKQEPCKRVLNMYLMATYMILCGLRPVYSYFIVHTVSLLMLQEKRHRMRTSWCVSSCLSIIVGPTGLVWRSRPWWMVGYSEYCCGASISVLSELCVGVFQTWDTLLPGGTWTCTLLLKTASVGTEADPLKSKLNEWKVRLDKCDDLQRFLFLFLVLFLKSLEFLFCWIFVFTERNTGSHHLVWWVRSCVVCHDSIHEHNVSAKGERKKRVEEIAWWHCESNSFRSLCCEDDFFFTHAICAFLIFK